MKYDEYAKRVFEILSELGNDEEVEYISACFVNGRPSVSVCRKDGEWVSYSLFNEKMTRVTEDGDYEEI